MKSLIVFLSLLSAAAVAGPLELQGKFSFNGDLTKLSSSVVEPVYAFTQAGRERLTVLKADGYTCKALPRQTYRCRKFDKSLAPRTTSLDRVQNELTQESVEFIGVQSAPNLISNGDYLEVYEIKGNVMISGEVFDKYDYWITKYSDREVHKIIFRGAQRFEYIVHSVERLSRVKQFANSEKKRFFKFIYSGDLTLF